MSVVSLDIFKMHVRADEFAQDDEYLQYLLDVSEQAVTNATNRSLAELIQMGNGDIPSPIHHAIMLLGAHLYNQRESVSTVQMHEVPDSLQALIKPYVKLSDGAPSGENGTEA